MKTGFYSRIAWNNLLKNYRFYIPHILTGMGLLGTFYIVLTLALDERIAEVRGGAYISSFMVIGTGVMILLSTILMMYTNRFLMKQRTQEFGLYNILGMEKRHIIRVLFYETLFSGVCAMVSGLLFGMLFYKLGSLLICKLLKVDIIFGFYFIRPKTILLSALFFFILYALSFVSNCLAIGKMKPIELFQSSRTGEREPRVKWLILILGIITLGLGYFISLTVDTPIQALLFFFVAVVLVIIGTYCLFVSGSIFVLKLLKNNPRYYYHKRHMTTVSGLLYRMKQNAVGLASITILSTMVLIMISTTVSLYAGMNQTLTDNYPQHAYLISYYTTDNGIIEIPQDVLSDIMRDSAEKYGLHISSIEEQRYLSCAYLYRNDTLYGRLENGEKILLSSDISSLSVVIFITSDEYQSLTGTALKLQSNEIAVCPIAAKLGETSPTVGKVLNIENMCYQVKTILSRFPIEGNKLASISNYYGVVVADDTALEKIYAAQKANYGKDASEYTNRLAVTYGNIEDSYDIGFDMYYDVANAIAAYTDSHCEYDLDCNGERIIEFINYWEARTEVLGMYGSLLFLGILLGLVFMCANVLIIYYKQISEGYEDRYRFQIMEKIGMSNEEVRKTIGEQIILVFLLPLVVAGIHVLFAFPILMKLMQILMLTNVPLYILCTLVVFVIFSIVYYFIYSMTARTYYKIVH